MLRIFAASVVLLAAGASGAGAQPAATPAPAKTTGATGGREVAVLETAQGTIVIRFHEQDAPKTVANFKKLVREKFYDGTYFHRVIPNFMIQGGDPNSKDADPNNDGMGGPGYTVPAEIKLPHLRGSVATARTGDPVNPSRASSGSQFFIDLAAQPSLDAGGYTVFGEVLQGMDAVDKIAALANDPTTPRSAAGPNPGRKALVKRAWLEPLAKYEKAAGKGEGAAKSEAAPADTSKK
ncbi:MAG: peptidylprolyl isomerase [Candidatus Eisenbacteria bacterium]|uniref:Peptidyl-prolyl cis-trans isomerase n=1 Tax=Eiseniibacteriota bacterium TaxID=2212470 RepID=A0A9D6LBE7_UNCEI|nr:peptidylprolyl isomerase [Candidatus Eisenbacteria bacterium]MBI3540063.1 peptidylprolyl isomerase [Candidatus Eisenbacteria bacterium]